MTWAKTKGSWILFSPEGEKLDSLTFDPETQHYRDREGKQLSRNFNDAVFTCEARQKKRRK